MSETVTLDPEKTAIGAVDTGATMMVMEPQAEVTQFAANVDCPVCHTPNPPSETYCIDCGFLLGAEPVAVADMPELVVAGMLVTTDGTREFHLKPGENTIGREDCDILLVHNTVSRRHAKITVEDGRTRIEDLGSTNGTTLDGDKVAGEPIDLKDGCEIVFGSMALKYVAPEAGEGEAPTDLPTSEETEFDEAPEVPVGVQEPETPSVGKLVSKDGAYSFDLVNGVNTIGRREGNSIVIPDPYCSGQHAELLAEDGRFTITDLGSTNGTLVNGVKLEPNMPRELQPGDEITLGRPVFKIEVAS
ncbi:MAG: FHA domain-containing protein [Armatimonadetes bacterium]|nr:FHA domain-containing protein [Armatimonadota bacterium]